jgi:hypothetical protein
MSKYPFFGKRGRPSLKEVEVCKKINELITSKQVKLSEVEQIISAEGTPVNEEELQTLYSFLTGENPAAPIDSQQPVGQNPPLEKEPIHSNVRDQDLGKTMDDIDVTSDFEGVDPDSRANSTHNADAIDFDPFADPVVERAYTKGFDEPDTTTQTQEPEAATDQPPIHDNRESVQFDSDDFTEPTSGDPINQGATGEIPDAQMIDEDDIPEAKFSNTVLPDEEEEDAEIIEEEKEPLGGDNLDDLSPAQKRRAAEKTADAILQAYSNFIPLPFKAWASFSEKKISKLRLEGKINMKMRLEDGITVEDYIEGVNNEVEEIFTVTDETKDEIREPLIDVLLEQELALTPTQRLMMAVGSHLVTMGFSAFKLSQNNKMAIETFIQFHEEQQRARGGNAAPPPSSHSQTSQGQGASRAKPSRPNYASEAFTGHDADVVSDLMDSLGGDGGNKSKPVEDVEIIDAENDPSITVDYTTED